jgi:hypothetical protein
LEALSGSPGYVGSEIFLGAEAAGRADLIAMWAGLSANLSGCTVILAFLTSLVDEVSENREPVTQSSAAGREKQILK